MSVIKLVPTPSPPSRGAWIEILVNALSHHGPQSPPSRGAWIEIAVAGIKSHALPSPPSRGAWIEIFETDKAKLADRVAPLAGGVD